MKIMSPRQREILNLVTRKGDLEIKEIHQTLGISQATVYREIQVLIDMGLVAGIPGGISTIEAQKSRCLQCGQENNPRTAVFIEQVSGEKLAACCSHCGMMAFSNLTNIRSAMTPDFFNGTMLNVRIAWYVVNSSVSLCCQPSVLSFSQREIAENFAKGFGGSVLDFFGTRKIIGDLMAI